MLKQINTVNFFTIFFLLFMNYASMNAQMPETKEDRIKRVDDYNRAVEDPRNRINALRNPSNNRVYRDSILIPDQTFRKNLLKNLTKADFNIAAVIDGNTLRTDQVNFLKNVRINGIDAPEKGQTGYEQAKIFLEKKLADKSTAFYYSLNWSFDLDSVYLIKIEVDGKDIGYEMLSQGLVWYDKSYEYFLSKEDAKSYNKAFKQARKSKIGIWKDNKPEAPWKFRDRQRRSSSNS